MSDARAGIELDTDLLDAWIGDRLPDLSLEPAPARGLAFMEKAFADLLYRFAEI